MLFRVRYAILNKTVDNRKVAIMKEIHLLGKKINIDASPVILSYRPDEHWESHFKVMGGKWWQEGGWLYGEENGNKGGILFTRECFQEDVMLSFTVATVLPATRDLNAVFCAHWDEETDYLGESYVCGLNGWYEHKSGIERNLSSNLYTTTSLYHYEPGSAVRMCAGAINGHCFMTVDDVLVSELIDPSPIRYGHVGFSPYCTKLKITDIEVRKIAWEPFRQTYLPEF